MAKIIIADVLYTATDETFYVLNRTHDNALKYIAETLEDTFYNLEADGWRKCGKVNKADSSIVDMLVNHNAYIAVWEEPLLSEMKDKPVWEIIQEAIATMGKDEIENVEIRNYIKLKYPEKYNKLHSGTMYAQIAMCCVNRQSRVNYPINSKPRKADDKRYDFLYYLENSGNVMPYKPDMHGFWEIIKVDDGLQVRRIDEQKCVARVSVYPDDLPDSSIEYLEGKKKEVTVNTYERNPVARQLCVEHYGSDCFICGFDFGKIYGKECGGMIHVHHLKMISGMDGEYVIDPINDLRPVCPNCHMVLHSKKDGYTIEEVKVMINENMLRF